MDVFSWPEKQDKLHNNKNYYPEFDMNVWLRSCEQEIVDPIEGTTSGTIPEWLNGHLIRNGPGSLKIGNDDVKHYFDCPALLQKFNIENGKVTYQNRFLQSDSYRRNSAANRIVRTEFGTKAVPDPCQTIFRKVTTLFKPTKTMSDNSPISIYPFGDEVYALGDVPVIHRIDKESLKTEGKVDISNHVTVVHHTSHPHVTSDGSIYNLGLSYSVRGLLYSVVKFPKKDDHTMFDQASIVAQIPVNLSLNPSYMHSFGITENYFVIVEQPLCVSVTKMVKTVVKNDPIAGCFRWFGDTKTRIYLLDRERGNLKYTFYSEPLCYMHIINQYETSDYVVLDICIYNNASFMNYMYIDAMKTMHMNENYAEMFKAKPVRFLLPLSSGAKSEKIFVKPEILVNIGCELPRINYENNCGKFYQYFYAISNDVNSSTPGAIIKVDTSTNTWKIWNEKDCYLSEAVFVGRPNCQDDGVVLCAILWSGNPNRVGLLVLDAARFEEIGRTVFEGGTPVPRCLHGWFLPKHDQ